LQDEVETTKQYPKPGTRKGDPAFQLADGGGQGGDNMTSFWGHLRQRWQLLAKDAGACR
jgi:hypothetical protein